MARSNILLLNMLGARVRVVAPSTLLPPAVERLGVEVYTDMREGLADADIVMMLRLQLERMTRRLRAHPRANISTSSAWTARSWRAPSPTRWSCIPGPMNRGVEIDSDVADDARSVIREQVEMGVAVRMAVLQALARHLPNR